MEKKKFILGFSETIYHSIEVEADSAEEIEDDVYEFLDTNYPNWLDDTDKDSVDFNFDDIIEEENTCEVKKHIDLSVNHHHSSTECVKCFGPLSEPYPKIKFCPICEKN